PLGPRPGDGDLDLLPAPAVAAVQRRRLGDDGLVQHQPDGAPAVAQAPLEPPLACRQVAGRPASRWPGRFPTTCRPAIASRTLWVEISRPCASRRNCRRSGAVHTAA